MSHATARSPIRNRRREIRHAACLGCTVRRKGWQLLGDRMVDLSPRGMLFLCADPVDVGAKLLVSFRATELAVPFETRATVARVVQGRRRDDTGRALGLRFDSLPAVSRLILRGYLRRLPTSSVARREPPPEFAPQGAPVDYAGMVQRVLAESPR
jgi:hypothetical protein